jgi:hypothetical protein
MAGFHKNTTIVEHHGNIDATTRLFIDPILRRNVYLGHVHDMLSTMPAGRGRDDIVVEPTIPPPCGLWPAVMAKVGQHDDDDNRLGATSVFAILRDRLATWIPP